MRFYMCPIMLDLFLFIIIMCATRIIIAFNTEERYYTRYNYTSYVYRVYI